MATESLKKAVAKYDKANTKQVHLKLNIKTDKDILEQLERKTNKQGYIKALIRADINSNILYKCDYKKNKKCKKTSCQTECFFTSNKRYSADGKTYIYNDDINSVEEVE